MRSTPYALILILVLASPMAWAQQPPGSGPMHRHGPPEEDILVQNFFPPELVMEHQKAIGLKEDQRAAIKAEMQKVLSRFTELQWQQHAEEETMGSLLKQQDIDEKQVLAQLDKLLAIENEIKRMHFALLIKVKNILTPEQQAKLKDLKKQGPVCPLLPAPGPGSSGPPQGPRPPAMP